MAYRKGYDPEESARLTSAFNPSDVAIPMNIRSSYSPKDIADYGIDDINDTDTGASPDASPVPLTDIPTSSLDSSRPRTVAAGYQEYVGSRKAGAQRLGKMTVMFRDGTLYNYYDVTPGEWQTFKASISKGAPWLNRKNSKQGSDGLFIGKPQGPADLASVDPEVQSTIWKVARSAQVRYATSRVTHVKMRGAEEYGLVSDTRTVRPKIQTSWKNGVQEVNLRGSVPKVARKKAGTNIHKNNGKNPYQRQRYMPKVHNIGRQHFIQYFRLPANWGKKIVVRGDTQEINEPFRTSKPIMIRLPFYRVLVIGKWVGQLNEEEALNKAIQGRVLKDEDFQNGWTPPAATKQAREEDIWDIYL